MDPLALASELAQEAGAILRERLYRPRDIAEKRSRDLVTDADRASEEHIVARLRAARPNSAILGEESGVTAGSNGERWIIDPLDGTTNYAHHYPLFCVSIACEQDGVVVAGAIYAPILNELYTAGLGAGAFCNGRQIHVSAIDQVREALVCTGFVPGRHDRNLGNFASVSREAQAVRRDGSAALDLASVAMGRFDAFWEFELKPWDVAAGALLVREAGGTVTAVDGTAYEVHGGSILATNSHFDSELRSLLTPSHTLPCLEALSEI